MCEASELFRTAACIADSRSPSTQYEQAHQFHEFEKAAGGAKTVRVRSAQDLTTTPEHLFS